MPELLQSVYISQHVFNYLVLNAKSLEQYHLICLFLTFMRNSCKIDNLSPSLMVVYMKQHMAVVTAQPVVY